jgi:hypothetical protein
MESLREGRRPVRGPRAAARESGPEELGDAGLDELEDERSLADELIDDLLPPEFDWRGVVRRHPVPSLLVAAAGGYLLARSRGPKLVTALAELVALQVGGRVSERLGALGDDDAEIL